MEVSKKSDWLIIQEEILLKMLKFKPDAFSIELTHENEIFYTIKKGEYTFFVSNFLNKEDRDKEDEAAISIFKNKKQLPSLFSSLDNVFNHLNEIIDG